MDQPLACGQFLQPKASFSMVLELRMVFNGKKEEEEKEEERGKKEERRSIETTCSAKPKIFDIWSCSENVKRNLYQVHKMVWYETLYYLQGLIQSRSVQPDYPSPEEIKSLMAHKVRKRILLL